jgi:hypothetical protein
MIRYTLYECSARKNVLKSKIIRSSCIVPNEIKFKHNYTNIFERYWAVSILFIMFSE